MPEKQSLPRLSLVRGGEYRHHPAGGPQRVIDFRRVFDTLPIPILLLSSTFVIVDMNDSYLATVGRRRNDLVGLPVFDAFPNNPDDSDADGVENLRASLERVVGLQEPDTMKLQRYDVIDPWTGRYEERYWSPINIPLLDDDGTLALIMHRVVEVTELVQARQDVANESPEARHAGEEIVQAELVARADMLRSTVDGLRAAHVRDERRTQNLTHALEVEAHIAAALQQAMLPRVEMSVPDVDIAARYLPADNGLRVGGDWFDIIELERGLVGLVVGDVVGRGLSAAAVMGQLRSATMTATIATHSPSRALQILDQLASSVVGASCATAFAAVIDVTNRRVTYSSAGHPPALVVRSDGHADLLDAADGVPLGIDLDRNARAETIATLAPEDTLVLYTDGLIERRHHSIDAGIQNLIECVASHRESTSNEIATHVMTTLDDPRARQDDIAVIVCRLS